VKVELRLSTTTSSSDPYSKLDIRSSDDPHLSSLIWNPNHASPHEATWLDAIADSLTSTHYSVGGEKLKDKQKLEVRPVFIKYFNVQEALERIPIHEGLKRKVVWEVLGRMELDFDACVEKDEGGDGWLP